MKAARPTRVSLPKGAARLDSALHLASLGLPVFPLHWPVATSETSIEDATCSCNDPECRRRIGKHPLESGWQDQATTEPAQIKRWWTDYPHANIGIATGGSFFVIDVDGTEGNASFTKLEDEHGALPKTLRVSTGRGFHVYLAASEGIPLSNRVGALPGIDVRTVGGYVVGPGSLHWNGAVYDIAVDAALAPAPDWLVKIISTPPTTLAPAANRSTGAPPVEEPEVARVPLEERRRRALAYVEKADPAISGQGGHGTAMRVATAVVRGFALREDAARDVLGDWSARCEPPWSEKELAHKIADALRVGAMSWGAKLITPTHGFAPQSIVALAEAHRREDLTYMLPHFKIASGRPTLLGGFSGVGKTLLAQELALAVTTPRGRCWGDLEVDAALSRVLHLDYEMGRAALVDRYRRLAAGMGKSLPKRGANLFIESMPRLYLSDDPKRVEASLLDVCDDVGLVILDNLRAACPHAKSENDSAMRLYLDILTRVSEVTGCLFVVLVHEGKQQSDGFGRPGAQRVRGSGAIVDAAGGVLSVSTRRDVLRIEQTKASFGPPGAPVHVQLIDGKTKSGNPSLKIASVEGMADDGHGRDQRRCRARIIEKLREAPDLNVSTLIKAVGGRRKDLIIELNDLREKGVVIERPGPHTSKLLRLASGGGDDA